MGRAFTTGRYQEGTLTSSVTEGRLVLSFPVEACESSTAAPVLQMFTASTTIFT
jgi:hypothetical protein